MKRILFLIFFVSNFIMGFSQQLLVLDNYTIPLNQKGATVGKFIVSEGKTVSLINDAGIFVIDKENNLCLKNKLSIATGMPISYRIVVKYGDEQKDFELVKDEFIHNKVIAHRGAWKHHEVHQNSLGSLKNAIELGCEASEFDVWLTKDRKIVLNHDADLEGMLVEKTNLDDLRKIQFQNGEVVPTLDEYIQLIKTQNKTRLVLEIKSATNQANERAKELADSVVKRVHLLNAQAWVDYISFDYEALLEVRRLDSTASISYLSDNIPMDLLKIEKINGIDYYYLLFGKIPHLYERAKMLGLTINVWTVNDEKQMKEFLDRNVDFITTDEPELLLQLN
jgi:glycerophosphoryl diester phosphodiesterase